MNYSTKNYSDQGGNRLVIGGTLELTKDATMTKNGVEVNLGGGGSPSTVAWGDVTGKPATYAPSAHTHVVADVTGLQAMIDGKSPTSHTHTIAQVTGLQAAIDGKLTAVKATATANSVATDAAGLVVDFNALLAKLKTAGLML